MESTLKRTWADIDLDALEHNYKTLRNLVGPNVKFLGVVKADAYGHGSVQCSRVLQQLGADYLAVSSIDEAMELRLNGISMPVLILGHTPRDQVSKLVEYHITQAVTSLEKAKEYSEEAVRCGQTLKIHIKVDTGMSRLGFLCTGSKFDSSIAAICEAIRLPNLEPEGIFTHFSVADNTDADSTGYTNRQRELFLKVTRAVEAKWDRIFEIRHCANTGGVALHSDTWMDMVRPGLLLYGYGDYAEKLGLRPVMTLKTTVSTVKEYDPDTSVSYGRTYVTGRTTRLGVLPYGYADGFLRALSNKCSLYTKDGFAPQRGRICMDMCMVDLTELPMVKDGDEVEIFGSHNSVNTMAEAADTIPYELTCSVSKRVPRFYYRNGELIEKELILRL